MQIKVHVVEPVTYNCQHDVHVHVHVVCRSAEPVAYNCQHDVNVHVHVIQLLTLHVAQGRYMCGLRMPRSIVWPGFNSLMINVFLMVGGFVHVYVVVC